MSFSIYLNSAEGRKIVAGFTNQIEYNFAFDKTPEHKGGYKVYMTFCSQFFSTRVFSYYFEEIYVNVDLGVCNSYTPVGLYTGTRNNRLLGIIRRDRLEDFVTQYNPATGIPPGPTLANIQTANFPANSATNAFTLTTTGVMPSGYNFAPANQTVYSGWKDNPPVYLTTKPTNNQFLVTLSDNTGALHYEPEFQNTDYGLILTFEAI
jgi:hypothetical protein